MVRVTVPLEREERAALMQLAEREKRDERQQAAFLIRQALESLGLLTASVNPPVLETRRERA